MNEFDDLTDLDDVFGPLRTAARSAELSHERPTVDLMVKAHRTSEGKHMFTSRHARIATLVATGILGFGGMAAASPNLGGNKPAVEERVVEEVEDPIAEVPAAEESLVEVPAVEEPAAEESVIEEPAVEVQVVEEPVVEESAMENDPDTFFDESTCLDEKGNHGETVSAVARGGVFPEDVSVRDAAHSSCGKNEVAGDSEVDDSEVADESDVDDEIESADESEDSGPKADRPSRNDSEKSNNGNGNGNGKHDD